MKLFRKRRKLNNKGLSLVELVCAVAIFAVATTVIGGAMVVSAQNYSRGTNELDLQQEAQTATNLIGDLLYDATGATYNSGTKTLEIEGAAYVYRIVHEGTVLKYEQYVRAADGSISLSASGVLAENVLEFKSNNLNTSPSTFEANKNVEILLKIGDTNRSYKAEYSTTARNGKADSSGITESAEIIIERELVLEPGQTFVLPFEVVGTITNKAVSVTSASGLSISPGSSSITITPSALASGVISFRVATLEMKKLPDGTITSDPMAYADVDVKIRRVNGITSPMDSNDDQYADGSSYWTDASGNGNYKAGTEYRIDFDIASHTDYANKVFGKAYDMNYVNPKQVDISYTMAGGNINDYVENVQINTVDNPSITFRLKQDMPNGSEIILTANAKHPSGTNKTGSTYGTVQDVVKIKCDDPLFTASNLVRGSDGIKIEISDEQLNDIEALMVATTGNSNMQHQYGAIMTVYEVAADGSKTQVFPTYLFGNTDDDIKIDAEDSKRLAPEKKYVIKMELMFYHDAGKTLPYWPAGSPYYTEIPLDAVSIEYKKQTVGGEQHKGTLADRYEMSVGVEQTIAMNVRGVNMEHHQNALAFKFQMYNESTGQWVDKDPDDINKDVSSYVKTAQVGDKNRNSGEITYRFQFDKAGRYRAMAKLNNFTYSYYVGNGTNTVTYDIHKTDDANAGADEYGICYIDVN